MNRFAFLVLAAATAVLVSVQLPGQYPGQYPLGSTRPANILRASILLDKDKGRTQVEDRESEFREGARNRKKTRASPHNPPFRPKGERLQTMRRSW